MNIQAHIVGPRGVGKTTIARGLVRTHMNEGPTARAFIHDPMREFVDMAYTFASVDSWKRTAHASATSGKPMPRSARFTCKSSELVKLCTELGRKWNRAKNIRLPMILVIDEASKHTGSGPTHMSKEDNEALSTIRHLGVATVFNQQRLAQFPISFYEMASDLFLFRSSARDLDRYEEAMSLPRGCLAPALDLFAPDPDIGPTAAAPGEYIHARYGKGLV